MSQDSKGNRDNLNKKEFDTLSGIYGDSAPPPDPLPHETVEDIKEPKTLSRDRTESDRMEVISQMYGGDVQEKTQPPQKPSGPPSPPVKPFYSTPTGMGLIIAVVVIIAAIIAIVMVNPGCIMGCGTTTTPVPTQAPSVNVSNETVAVVPADSENATVNQTPMTAPVVNPPTVPVSPIPNASTNSSVPDVTPVPTNLDVPAGVVPVVPNTTPLPPASVPAIPTTPAITYSQPVLYTPEEVNKHFIMVVFGNNRKEIEKFEDPVISVSIIGNATDTAAEDIGEFSRIFNALSSESVLPVANYKADNANINLIFLNNPAMANVEESKKFSQIIDPDTRQVALIYWNQSSAKYIYLNTDMPPEKSEHYLLRGLLIGLGFYGETPQYPDSIFYARKSTTTELSDLDKAAIQILYGHKIDNRMTLEDVKKVLVI
jgi:hypothetical protein